MPRLRVLSANKVCKILQKHGFERVRHYKTLRSREVQLVHCLVRIEKSDVPRLSQTKKRLALIANCKSYEVTRILTCDPLIFG